MNLTTKSGELPKLIGNTADKHPNLLQHLQGNILKGHGRDNAWNLFFHFDERQAGAIKHWLANINITSAEKQLADTKTFKEIKEIEPKDRTKEQNETLALLISSVVTFFFISHTGYNAFGIDTSWLDDESFKTGMKNRSGLNDPLPKTWDFSKTDNEADRIDAMLLLASDNFGNLQANKQSILATLPQGVTLIHEQFGETLRDPNNIGLEHFGYVDGISQPVMLQTDNKNGGKLWDDDTDPFDVALVKDGSVADPDAFGSYFVFRKLDQNVKDFKEEEEGLGLDEIGGAYVVGRFEDGTPVTKYDVEQHVTEEAKLENDFNYKNDPDGNRCPYHAHIRMTNPRDLQPDKPIRIVRRGIPYDEAGRHGNLVWHPKGKVGLLFMCYQKSIQNQFEVLQINWANDGNFSASETNGGTREVAIDGIIGQGTENKRQQFYPQVWDGEKKISGINMAHFVTMKGGEYFFAPSLLFLKSLAAVTELTAKSKKSKSFLNP